MANLFRDKYRIESTRLKYWDYSSNGAYFITICTKNRSCVFGNITNGKIKLSDMGKIVKECWYDLPNHYWNCGLDSFVIMPNHVHGIIIINNDLDCENHCRDAINRVSTGGITKNHNPMLSKSLSTIIRWFKGRTTFEINKINDSIDFKWQARFYEHIIRNERELNAIREYIINNPRNWEYDRNCTI